MNNFSRMYCDLTGKTCAAVVEKHNSFPCMFYRAVDFLPDQEALVCKLREQKRQTKRLDQLIKTAYPLLTDKQKKILDLFYIKRFTESEIANQLDIDLKTVNEHIYGKKLERHGKSVCYGGIVAKIKKQLFFISS